MSVAIDRPGAAHRPRVILLSSAVIVLAFVGQTAVLPAVGLSATIPLVLTSVCVLGVALGSRTGAVAGFAAGLLLDLTGSGVLGIGALVGCVLGASAGGIQVDRWRWSGLVRVWLYTLAAAMVMTGANAFLQGLGLRASGMWFWLAAGSAVCAAVLLPLRDWMRAVVR